MIFISDVHHGLDSLENLPSGKGPLVILGDLINWIDYRNGDGIAKDVFGEESVTKLVELRKKHDFTRRKELWNELFSKDRENKQKLRNLFIDNTGKFLKKLKISKYFLFQEM
ncbi:hypothetical protein OA181_00845 [Acidimicrobiaceae bacterium]|nr:hypothetical protein [Acidimicrobiaceae bacterium]